MLGTLLVSLLAFCEPETPARPTLLVVVGASGTDEYGKQFRGWAERWRQAAQRGGAACSLIGVDEAAGDDREALARRLAEERQRPGAALWLVLIGHGTFDGKTARFNLRGPDVSAAELSEWLEGVQRPLAVVDCASASGP
ncbi:MAG: hypothetical protein ACREHD_15770, partial [Pirellulales bacterium]